MIGVGKVGATAWEIGKMQRWRWEELICGNLKVGKVGLAGSLVHAGNWGAFSAGF